MLVIRDTCWSKTVPTAWGRAEGSWFMLMDGGEKWCQLALLSSEGEFVLGVLGKHSKKNNFRSCVPGVFQITVFALSSGLPAWSSAGYFGLSHSQMC